MNGNRGIAFRMLMEYQYSNSKEFMVAPGYAVNISKGILMKYQYIAYMFVLVAMMCFPDQSEAQSAEVIAKGYVLDGDDGKGMENVHIYAKGSGRVTKSRRDGFFAFTVLTTDTLVFSYVGYESTVIPMWKVEDDQVEMMVQLKKGVVVLEGVDIYGDYETPEYLMKKKGEPMYMFGKPKSVTEPKKADVPLGSTTYGPMSYFSKEAKEKRKMIKYYQEAVKDTTYVNTVNDPRIRNDFKRMYAITDETYDVFLRHFNTSGVLLDKNNAVDIERVMHMEFLKWIKSYDPQSKPEELD